MKINLNFDKNENALKGLIEQTKSKEKKVNPIIKELEERGVF